MDALPAVPPGTPERRRAAQTPIAAPPSERSARRRQRSMSPVAAAKSDGAGAGDALPAMAPPTAQDGTPTCYPGVWTALGFAGEVTCRALSTHLGRKAMARRPAGKPMWRKREVLLQERIVQYTTVDNEGVVQELVETYVAPSPSRRRRRRRQLRPAPPRPAPPTAH